MARPADGAPRAAMPPSSVELGPLRPGDLDAALALSAGEGWNQTAADWARLLRLEPSGCFAARDADRLVGTVTTTTYESAVAWIGMMIVHADHRGLGIGSALMRLALEHLHRMGSATVMLDATPAGRPLYESLGFVAVSDFERWQGIAPALAEPPTRHVPDEWRGAIRTLDRRAFGADRSRLLAHLIADGATDPLVVESADGSPAGYALARRGRVATYIGPIVATSASAAVRLLDGMLARLTGGEVCLDLHLGGLLAPAEIAERRLSTRRTLTRMRRTTRGDAATPRSICASAGPEYG